MSIALELEAFDQVLSFEPDLLVALADRQMALDFDIYSKHSQNPPANAAADSTA